MGLGLGVEVGGRLQVTVALHKIEMASAEHTQVPAPCEMEASSRRRTWVEVGDRVRVGARVGSGSG